MTPATAGTVFRITLATLFPFRFIQDRTITWALGDDPEVHRSCVEWFRTVMEGVYPREATPQTFTPGQLKRIDAPTLLVLGSRDGLAGDPAKIRPLAAHVPDIRIEVLGSGHLIGVECADEVNRLLLDFLAHTD